MNSFSPGDPLELVKQLAEGTLLDAATGLQLASGSLGAPLDAGVPGVSFSAEAGSSLSLFAYGGKGGEDPAGVVCRPLPTPGAADALRLPPPLSPEGKVYLAYRLDAFARAGVGGGLGFFGASAETERKLTLSDYRGHPPERLLREAVLADCARLRNALSSEDLAAIRPGDALALASTGRLSASLTLSWSDVLPGVLGRLAGLLPGANHLVAMETNLGASLHASAKVEDDFVLVFSRPEPGKLRASILRGETCSAGAGGGLSASVAFDASAPVEAVLGALLGRPLQWVDDTIARFVQGLSLDDRAKAALAFVLDRVGLAGGEADPQGLLARWESLKELLRGQLRELVTVRINAGLAYDFSRTEQKQALFQALLPDGEALEHHGALLRGDLAAVLNALRARGRAPEVYLRQHSVERRQAWGFSLGLPLGISASSTDEDRLRFVTTTRGDGQRRLAALGARAYRGDLFGASAEWGAELQAEMPGFSAAPEAKDFRYGLHLFLSRQGKSLDAGALAQLVDDAVVWGAVSESDRAQVLEQVKARAGNGQVDARVELTVPDEALRALLPAAAAAGPPLLARALARAMPWYGWRARQNADVRGATYLPLWEGLIRDGGWAPRAAALAAAKALARHPIASDTAAAEGQWPSPGLLTFASLVNAYPTVAACSQRMLAGLKALASTIDSALAADAIDAAFQQLRDGWGQSFPLRAFGALVVALAAERGALKLVQRTFTVSLPDAGAQLAFTTSR